MVNQGRVPQVTSREPWRTIGCLSTSDSENPVVISFLFNIGEQQGCNDASHRIMCVSCWKAPLMSHPVPMVETR